MSRFDLVIRNGTVADGGGGELKAADVAISDGRIAAVGAVPGAGREEIDARGKLVTPGFVDIHTHYDGHVTWENRLIPSSDHGVTTALMGNCGVGFAPCKAEDRDALVRLMAGVEDIPELVMTEGLAWNWETFPEYLDVVGAMARDADVATQIPHSALRVYVMGQRAIEHEPANADDIARMARLAREAMDAGALGFASSRALHQRSSDGKPVPTLRAGEDELLGIAQAVASSGHGVLQMLSDWGTGVEEEFGLMRTLVERTGLPLSYTLHQRRNDPDAWRRLLDLTARANRDGFPMRGQVICRPTGLLFGLELSMHPFSGCPSYAAIAALPFAEKVAAMRDPELRARLIAEEPVGKRWAMMRDFALMYPLGDPPDYEPAPERSIANQAKTKGVSPAEIAYDLMLANDGRAMLLAPIQDYEDGDGEATREMMEHPDTMLGLGDAGAHCGLVCDASYSTWALTHWTRDRTRGAKLPLPWIVRALTAETAAAVGLHDRGLLAPGYKADVNVIDYDALRLAPPEVAYDLPAGGRRIIQRSAGYEATIVSGEVTYREGVHTGALPGKLIRGARGAPA